MLICRAAEGFARENGYAWRPPPAFVGFLLVLVVAACASPPVRVEAGDALLVATEERASFDVTVAIEHDVPLLPNIGLGLDIDGCWGDDARGASLVVLIDLEWFALEARRFTWGDECPAFDP